MRASAINLAEIERLAKAAHGYFGFTVPTLMEHADMPRPPAEFINAVSPDVVLRLVAALRAGCPHACVPPCPWHRRLAEHGITDEAAGEPQP